MMKSYKVWLNKNYSIVLSGYPKDPKNPFSVLVFSGFVVEMENCKVRYYVNKVKTDLEKSEWLICNFKGEYYTSTGDWKFICQNYIRKAFPEKVGRKLINFIDTTKVII